MVVGGMLAFPDRPSEALSVLIPEHFHDQRCAKIFAAITALRGQGHVIDLFAVASTSGVELSAVTDLRFNTPGPPRKFEIELVQRHYASRRLMEIGGRLVAEATVTSDPWKLGDEAVSDITSVETPLDDAVADLTWDEIIDHSEDISPWTIPGMLRSDWRAVVVAGEGSGKSTLLRQIGICASQGIHPLNFRPMMPIRVVLIDLENPQAAMAETGKVIVDRVIRVNGGFDYEGMHVYSRPGGIDIRTARDRTAVERIIAKRRPDLVIMGPLNKMGPRHGNEDAEERADGVIRVLDDLRTRYGFALIIEHHAPNGNGGAREMRPFGSQRWTAWPELGFGLYQNRDKDGLRLGRFRGDRMRCHWPEEIVRSSPWPWQGRWDVSDTTSGGPF